jgi:hypothetical protein
MKAVHFALMVALPLAASIGSATQDAEAAGSCNSTSGTCTGLITGLVAHTDAGVGTPAISAEVRIETTSTPGCTLTGGWWEIGPGREGILKMLSAAYLSGKPVTIKQTAATGTCFVAWAQI